MSASVASRLRTVRLGRAVPLLAALLEVLWSYPWMAWIIGHMAPELQGTPISLGGAVLIALATEETARTVLARRWPLWKARSVVLVSALALLAATVRVEIGGGLPLLSPAWGAYAGEHPAELATALAYGAFLLWRGLSIGREPMILEDLYRRFLTGLVGIALLLLVWRVGGDASVPVAISAAGGYAVAYFSVGLVALAVANFHVIEEQLRRHNEVQAMLQRRWLSIVIIMVLAITLVAIGMASLFSLDLAALLIHPFGVLAQWLLIGFLYAVALPLGFLAAALIYALRWLLHVLGQGGPPEGPQGLSPSDLQQAIEGQGTKGLPPEAVLAIKWGLLAILIGIVLLVLVRSLFRYQKGRVGEDVEELSDSLWSGEALWLELSSYFGWLARLFRRRRRRVPPVSPPLAASAEAGVDERVYTVRELYRALLWQAGRAGWPRRPFETPFEYGGRLGLRAGTAAHDLDALTGAYVRDRYGGVLAEERSLLALNLSWRRLRTELSDGSGGPTKKGR